MPNRRSALWTSRASAEDEDEYSILSSYTEPSVLKRPRRTVARILFELRNTSGGRNFSTEGTSTCRRLTSVMTAFGRPPRLPPDIIYPNRFEPHGRSLRLASTRRTALFRISKIIASALVKPGTPPVRPPSPRRRPSTIASSSVSSSGPKGSGSHRIVAIRSPLRRSRRGFHWPYAYSRWSRVSPISLPLRSRSV